MIATNSRKTGRRQQGLSYVEVLIATVLIATALVPAMDALRPAIQGASIHENTTLRHYAISGLFEELLARSFNELDTEAFAINDPATASVIFSDAPGSSDRRLVYLSRYDADNADGNGNGFDGTDAGLIWIKVQIEATDFSVEGLTSQYD